MRGGRRQDAERADRPERRSPLLRDVSIVRRRGRKARDRRRRKGRGAWPGFLATPRGGTRLLPLPFFFPSRRVSEAVMPWLLSRAKLVPAVAGSRSLPGETHVPLCPLQRLLSEKPEAPQRIQAGLRRSLVRRTLLLGSPNLLCAPQTSLPVAPGRGWALCFLYLSGVLGS